MIASAELYPQKATVAPRAWWHPDGETLPLEMQIRAVLDRGWPRVVNIFGSAGTGKTTALRHLAATLPMDKVLLLDNFLPTTRLAGEGGRLVVFASSLHVETADMAFALAPWETDDLIEYMLHTHRERSKTIMPRVLAATDQWMLGGLPELWAPVLEAFAADATLREVLPALRRYVRQQCGADFVRARAYALERILRAMHNLRELEPQAQMPEQVLRQPLTVSLLAGEQLAEEIAAGRFEPLNAVLPADVLAFTARSFSPGDKRLAALERAVGESQWLQPRGVSLLLAVDANWRPSAGVLKNLMQCQAAGAKWKGLDLRDCDMRGVNLQRADLQEARLAHAVADGGNFCGANLRGADLRVFHGRETEFSRADLTGAACTNISLDHAILEGAIFRDADLDRAVLDDVRAPGVCFDTASMRHASFKRAQIEGADFSHADLSGARFRYVRFKGVKLDWACLEEAELPQCDLEEIEAKNARFAGANLNGSYLTASTLTDACFRNASLRSSGLAEVQWENADLSGADLSGATFHMGSSRSGRVGSTIASEGTRTGFYTDEYNEQDYKPPEEIRKANLCGANLHGALVEGADFYLVDLRGAKYSEDQARHFARCGAILRGRC